MELNTATYDLKSYSNVYEPREDSFLLLDTLESELSFLMNLKPTLALEIGSGSGVIIASLARIFKQCAYFAVDINQEACMASRYTSELNNCNIEVLNSDLADGFENSMFDLILFNPPYVVTDHQEYNLEMINKAWAGGVNGREIIDKFLNKLPRLLSTSGVCYLLLLKENNISEIERILSDMCYNSAIISERKIIGEHLFIMKIWGSCEK